MENFIAVLQWTALIVAILIALSSLDDLFIDAVFWALKFKRWFVGRSGPGPMRPESMVEKPEQPLAIMLPAWKEFDVIATMVENAVDQLAYKDFMIFVGTYANDAETIAEVEKVAKRYKRVRHVRVPHDGPTCKADCLNHIVADILAVERERGIEFAGMILHDSEDVLHPLELHLFNYLLPHKDLIQLPVVSLEQHYLDLVAGTYMDEFAEWHAKDLVVRQRLAKTVPSAGVGTCFSRRAMTALMEEGDPFNTATLTEDYDIGNRLSERGMSAIIALYPVEFRSKRGVLFGLGPERFVTFSMPLCVREHFPNTFKTSYRQKARWILGISLQGWAQLGWSKSPVTNYFLFRDRKAIVTPTLAILGYVLLLIYVGVNLWALNTGGEFIPLFSGHPLEYVLLWFNLFALVARIGQRAFFVERIYGWGHAFMSVPRVFILSFINFAASWRALKIYVGSLFSGKSIAWDKTMHRFPTGDFLGEKRRPLGEILMSWEVVTPPALNKALIDQQLNGGELGQLLICHGLIDDVILAEALAKQADLPMAILNPDMVMENRHRLDDETMLRLRTVPFGKNRKGEVMLAMARPLTEEEAGRMRERLGKPFHQYIVPESVVLDALRVAVDPQKGRAGSLHVAPLHQLMLERKLISRKVVREALREYDVARHGTIGQYLVGKGLIDRDKLEALAAEQKRLVVSEWESANA